jgi:hypothetical protein
MTEPNADDTTKSAADEALEQQPTANSDTVAEVDQDSDTESAGRLSSAEDNATDAAI